MPRRVLSFMLSIMMRVSFRRLGARKGMIPSITITSARALKKSFIQTDRSTGQLLGQAADRVFEEPEELAIRLDQEQVFLVAEAVRVGLE